jgi:hypothetical protein
MKNTAGSSLQATFLPVSYINSGMMQGKLGAEFLELPIQEYRSSHSKPYYEK